MADTFVDYSVVNKREAIETRKQQQQAKYKALGDPVVRVMTQTIATLRPTSEMEDGTVDVETFTNLARRYIFEGRSKGEICAFNAGVSVIQGENHRLNISPPFTRWRSLPDMKSRLNFGSY